VADARVAERVRAYAKVCVSMSVSKLETLLRGNLDFRSTNEVEVLIVAGCSLADARVVEYVSVSVSVSNWCRCRNWRRFSIAAIRIGDASPKVALPLQLALGNSVFL
jgi:hypothetical protein